MTSDAVDHPTADAFRLVVLGDSVVWGQGLLEEDKFSRLVQRTLSEHLGRPVNIQATLAHSGAAILPPDVAQDNAPAVWGEIPCYYPSITRQVRSVPQPELVDLVLVDGGSNDMGICTVARFWHQASDVYRDTRQYFGDRMQVLLATILSTFPQARVIVSGYYPVIGHQTQPTGVESFLRSFSSALKSEGVGVEDLFQAGTFLLEEGFAVLRQKLASLSTAWADGSTLALRQAVEAVNTVEATAGRPQRVNFAPVLFQPENCLEGSSTWLWRTGLDDPLHHQREARAGEAPDVVDFLECPTAALGHPNQQGAQVYATAVMAALTPWARPGHWDLTGVPPVNPRLEVTLHPIPQPALGRPVTQEVTVWTRDQHTQQPVQGAVEITNHDALAQFPTNTPFTFTFHYHEFSVQGLAATNTRTLVRVIAPGYDPVWLAWW